MYKQQGIFYKAMTMFLLIIVAASTSCTDSSPSKNPEKRNPEWTKEGKDAMTKGCIKQGMNNVEDSIVTARACECITEKIASRYTVDQTDELLKKPKQELVQILTPIIKDCRKDIFPK